MSRPVFSLRLWRTCKNENRFEEIMLFAWSRSSALVLLFLSLALQAHCTSQNRGDFPENPDTKKKSLGAGALPALRALVKTNAGSRSPSALRPATPATSRLISHSPARFSSGLQQPRPFSPLFVLVALTGALIAACILLAWHSTSNGPPKLLGKWPAPSGHSTRH